jgi:hypothetical protein
LTCSAAPAVDTPDRDGAGDEEMEHQEIGKFYILTIVYKIFNQILSLPFPTYPRADTLGQEEGEDTEQEEIKPKAAKDDGNCVGKICLLTLVNESSLPKISNPLFPPTAAPAATPAVEVAKVEKLQDVGKNVLLIIVYLPLKNPSISLPFGPGHDNDRPTQEYLQAMLQVSREKKIKKKAASYKKRQKAKGKL